ncbi:unnamed protein product [Adineta steineri]|uniref:Uncharacterized protein n=1 Tax=Adineta steineri TaxID=433720 RepID=A0A815PN18_9BILA|nr:unnamed protein product [Adineta steineri]CAF3887170.1 unnamed protein product [Adineta steineri]CAF4196694.1 unnamed protein product [Adineta steineri]
MAVNTLFTAISINPPVIKIISNKTTELIGQIQSDIKNEKELSKVTYETCNKILQGVQKEYIRTQIEFVEETKILITKALKEPNIQFHKTWLQVFDMFATKCEQIAGPILQVLNSVALYSNHLKHKYRSFVTGATASSVLSTVLIGGLIIHFLPANICCFTLSVGAITLTAAGAVLAACLAIACVTGAITTATIRAVYNRCTNDLQLLLTKYFPYIFNAQKNVITQKGLNQAIKDALNTFKIKEDIWTNVDTLEMLERSIDGALDDLKKS